MKSLRQTTLALVAMLLLAGLAMAQDVQITQGPKVESTTDTTATIAWSTNKSASTLLNYGTDQNNLNQTEQAPWGGLTHRVTLKNLQPGTTYYLRATSGEASGSGTGAISQVVSFKTQGTASASSASEQSAQGNEFKITQGPNVEKVTDTGATVAWSTDRPSSSVVKYGTDPNNLNETAREPWGATTHRVQLSGLKPGTQYYFSVQSAQGKNAPGQQAQTPPMPFTTTGAQSASAGQSGGQAVRITNGPALESVGSDSVTVAWSTNVPSSSVVKYGTDQNNLNQTAQEPWGQTTHRVQLTNLQPNTRYYFAVQSAEAQGGGGQTAQAGPMPFMTAGSGQSVGGQTPQ